MAQSVGRLDLPESARAVLRALVTDGPATRPQLGQSLDLSRPTMSVAIAELARLGLVAELGSTQGATGRSAVLYSVAPSAGHVLGVEVASTRVRVAAHSMDGTQLSSREEKMSPRRRRVTTSATAIALELTKKVRADVGNRAGPLRDVVVAAPTKPTDDAASMSIDGAELRALPVPPEVPVVVENNVNCAAIAEHRIGVARGQRTFAYLQVGVKIGVGIVIDGKLLHGAHGAAGEVAMLPFPWSERESPRHAGLETHLGSDALMRRCAASWPASAGAAPKDAEALFTAAVRGDLAARRVVDQHARDIGRLAVAVLGVIDPGLVVLGGGVGQNQLVLPEVHRTLRELAWDTEVTVGALGHSATVLGAVHIAIARALDRMLLP
ncbi:ROK family transcriptional regulator [Fodinicola acaciae]|uniref:ROK family transcriptional regulator n=1 Tax=Fodinicola acaciae TaxID=2681555 RepID=UPI0013D099E6|nr:ROK family transcriptional regulator [Fodinicola acaciae]